MPYVFGIWSSHISPTIPILVNNRWMVLSAQLHTSRWRLPFDFRLRTRSVMYLIYAAAKANHSQILDLAAWREAQVSSALWSEAMKMASGEGVSNVHKYGVNERALRAVCVGHDSTGRLMTSRRVCNSMSVVPLLLPRQPWDEREGVFSYQWDNLV